MARRDYRTSKLKNQNCEEKRMIHVWQKPLTKHAKTKK